MEIENIKPEIDGLENSRMKSISQHLHEEFFK